MEKNDWRQYEWVTADFKKVKICDMHIRHITNTLKLLKNYPAEMNEFVNQFTDLSLTEWVNLLNEEKKLRIWQLKNGMK